MYLCSGISCFVCGEIENMHSNELCENCFKKQAGHLNEYREINKITEKIYLGSYQGARNKEKLLEYGISHILICGNRLSPLYPEMFTYCILNMEDTNEQEIISHLKRGLDFIKSADKIFIHCVAGVSRSPTVVLGYLIRNRRMCLEEALKYIKSKRYEASPNPNFLRQLKEFELCTNRA